MSASDELIGLRFDTVGDLYHQVRPRYPSEIWDRLFNVTQLQPGARVLEVGAGTGIATAELVRRGCHVTALEPGAAMAAIIESELRSSGQVNVRVGKLENLDWMASRSIWPSARPRCTGSTATCCMRDSGSWCVPTDSPP